jgi:hypothetical protein
MPTVPTLYIQLSVIAFKTHKEIQRLLLSLMIKQNFLETEFIGLINGHIYITHMEMLLRNKCVHFRFFGSLIWA